MTCRRTCKQNASANTCSRKCGESCAASGWVLQSTSTRPHPSISAVKGLLHFVGSAHAIHPKTSYKQPLKQTKTWVITYHMGMIPWYYQKQAKVESPMQPRHATHLDAKQILQRSPKGHSTESPHSSLPGSMYSMQINKRIVTEG